MAFVGFPGGTVIVFGRLASGIPVREKHPLRTRPIPPNLAIMKTPSALLAAALVALAASCAPSTPDSRIAENPVAYQNLTATEKALVAQGRIQRGMPPEAVFLAWGDPSNEFEGQEDGVNTRRWDYLARRAVHTDTVGAGFGWGGWGGGWGGPFWGPGIQPWNGVGVAPTVTYVPYRRASVWFRNNKVEKWERMR